MRRASVRPAAARHHSLEADAGGFAAPGFTVLRGVVPRGEIGELRARIDDAVANKAEGVDVRSGTVWIRDAGILGPAVDDLRSAADVLRAVSELLGPLPVAISSVMRNPIGPTAQQALHVDWAGAVEPGADQQVQAMFFIDDVTDDNGPTRLVPGSHRSRSVPPKDLAANPHSRHAQQVSVIAAAGDVLVFSSHLWHSGTANRSGAPRRVITITYRRGSTSRSA